MCVIAAQSLFDSGHFSAADFTGDTYFTIAERVSHGMVVLRSQCLQITEENLKSTVFNTWPRIQLNPNAYIKLNDKTTDYFAQLRQRVESWDDDPQNGGAVNSWLYMLGFYINDAYEKTSLIWHCRFNVLSSHRACSFWSSWGYASTRVIFP